MFSTLLHRAITTDLTESDTYNILCESGSKSKMMAGNPVVIDCWSRDLLHLGDKELFGETEIDKLNPRQTIFYWNPNPLRNCLNPGSLFVAWYELLRVDSKPAMSILLLSVRGAEGWRGLFRDWDNATSSKASALLSCREEGEDDKGYSEVNSRGDSLHSSPASKEVDSEEEKELDGDIVGLLNMEGVLAPIWNLLLS